MADAGLRPYQSAEAARAREERKERLRQMLQLRQAGVSGSEIARRMGISEPRVVQILREFRAPPPPRRSQEFEQRAFDILPQVEMREAQAVGLPRLVGQSRRCIDHALGMLRQCCPPPPRPSPLAEPTFR